MRPVSSVFAIALCFGAGLGLAPMVQVANACSCIDRSHRELVLVDVSGDPLDEAALADELDAWPTNVGMTAESSKVLYLSVNDSPIGMEMVK